MRTRYVKYKPKYYGGGNTRPPKMTVPITDATYATGAAGVSNGKTTAESIPYGQIGNFAGTATEALWDDVETADGMDSYQSKNELMTSNALKYAGMGASMGAMTGNPIGIAAGAVIGGTYGLIAGNKQGKKNEQLATEAYAGRERRRYLEGQQNYDLKKVV